MAKIDIIMPLYNKASVVMRSVESIRRQTFDDWRLIVVDDGSTDGSGDIVREIADDRIEVIRQENAGPGGARNVGIERATSEYIAFLDADDEWFDIYLENALAGIEDSDAAIVGTMYYEWHKRQDMQRHWEKCGVIAGEYNLSGKERPEQAENLMLFFHVGNSLVAAETARKYGGFYAENNCRFAEDTTFFMRIVFNERVKIIGPVAVCHHREASNLSNTMKDPLAPFLADSDVVLRYCPDEKLELMRAVLDRMAFRAVRKYARSGFKKDAVELLSKFPSLKTTQRQWRRCAFEIATSRWFKYWVGFKCAVGPRARLFLRKIARKVGLIQDSARSCDE
ncbi:MAG: glycosyltransferase family 2 protein [Planctomycetes bacterium]|nr:glycosyltransferase family 2 protein [Planctomycetota bacterium]